jgi:hypothetical protein
VGGGVVGQGAYPHHLVHTLAKHLPLLTD